eukprot:Ihof_evm2s798 gene=Ihof_evmTU2s798
MQASADAPESAKRALADDITPQEDNKKRTKYDSPTIHSETKRDTICLPDEHDARPRSISSNGHVNGVSDNMVTSFTPSHPPVVSMASSALLLAAVAGKRMEEQSMTYREMTLMGTEQGETRRLKEKRRKKRDIPPLDQWTYSPTDLMPQLKDHVGEKLSVLIQAKYLTRNNEKVHDRQVWGNDIYTDDSDLVAVLVHQDQLHLTDQPPNYDILVTCDIYPIREKYLSASRNGLKSRRCTKECHDGCSIMVVRVDHVKSKIDDTSLQGQRKEKPWRSRAKSKAQRKKERTNLIGQLVPDISVLFSLANDPCLRYTLNMVVDRGTPPRSYTSYRLRQEVLYLETDSHRYELSCQPIQSGVPNTFQWAVVRCPQLISLDSMKTMPCPLLEEHITTLQQ